MTTTRPPRWADRRIAAALGVTIAVSASGCSLDARGVDGHHVVGSGPSRNADPPLVREEDLGDGYRAAGPEDAEDLTAAGCLSAVSALGRRATHEMSVTFTTDNPFDSSLVTHTVLGFPDGGATGDAMTAWEDATANCDTVEHVEPDSTLRLDVTTDTAALGRAVTRQVNVIATGEVESDSLDLDVSQWISVARVRDDLSVVQVLDFDDSDAVDEGRRLARLTADRLDAWAD